MFCVAWRLCTRWKLLATNLSNPSASFYVKPTTGNSESTAIHATTNCESHDHVHTDCLYVSDTCYMDMTATYAVYKPFDITKVMATIYFCCQNNSFVKCLRDLIFMLGSNAQHQLIQLIFVCTSLFSRIVWKLMLRKIFVFYGMWPMLMPLYCLWCLVVTCTNMMLSCAVLFCTERSYLSQSSWLKQWLYSAWDF